MTIDQAPPPTSQDVPQAEMAEKDQWLTHVSYLSHTQKSIKNFLSCGKNLIGDAEFVIPVMPIMDNLVHTVFL